MNCYDCKHFSVTTLHQVGFGTRYSYHCRKLKKSMKGAVKDCKDIERGDSKHEQMILGG